MQRTLNHPISLVQKVAGEFVLLAHKAIRKSCFCAVVFSGGETPRRFYETLASKRFKSRIDWKHIYFFFGDERCVPPTNKLSNYRMVNEALLSKVPIPRENIFRVRGELRPGEASRIYAREIQKHFTAHPGFPANRSAGLNLRYGGKESKKDFPSFDLVLLGLGKDGHVASLFPKSKALKEKKRWVVQVYEKTAVPPHRITLTLPVINNAKNVWFLVAGAEKQSILKEVLQKGRRYPAQLVKPKHGRLAWFVDKQAFSEKL